MIDRLSALRTVDGCPSAALGLRRRDDLGVVGSADEADDAENGCACCLRHSGRWAEALQG